MTATTGTLWTIGHSTRPWEEFVALLAEASIACVVDVRRFAGSRRNPQFSPQVMAPALREAGVDYWPVPAFGGRRAPQPDSPNGAWRVAAFRGYADHMASSDYVDAREQLVLRARDEHCAVMCAEAVWWQCHRRLIADDFTARGWEVLHLMKAGRSEPHPLNPSARMLGDVLVYPPEQPTLI